MDPQAPPVAAAGGSHPLRRFAIFLAIALVLIAAIIWGVRYWRVGRYFISTDDAYVSADSSIIAPKVSGYVTAVPVDENQMVRQGQLLFTIDDRDYLVARDSAAADVQAAAAAISSDLAQVSLQRTKIAAAAAMLEGDQARLAFAGSNARRYASLTASGAGTQQSSEQAVSDLAFAKATLDADQAALQGARRQVDVLNAELAQARASLAQAGARLRQAALDLDHTSVRAPFEGVIGNKEVTVGDYLQTGNEVMAVVPLDQVYVTANYKETQLARMRRGQAVRIAVDALPGLEVTGRVDSIAPSSGQEFALLPPDNATGNFTKIVQRVPVKIRLDLNTGLIGRLLPGMSVEPAIDTRPKRPSPAR